MWNWIIRKLPKRVLKIESYYYPQVWFLWWHYRWIQFYDGYTAERFSSLDEAICMLDYRWKPKLKSKKTVVWRGK